MKQKLLLIMFALFATHAMGYAQDVSTTAQTETSGEIVVEKQPEFPGGMKALMQYLQRSIRYPAICQQQGIQGRVIVQFVVEVDGSITDVQVLKRINPHLDKEAVRVISNMPKWTPAMQRGENVRVRFTLPVSFRLANAKVKACVINPDNEEMEVEVDKMAQFSGGKQELDRYIKKHLKYPKQANGVQGRVEVTFVVNTDGRVSNVAVTKQVDPLLDAEAIRLVEHMPKWEPAVLHGIPVRIKHTLPIDFSLNQ